MLIPVIDIDCDMVPDIEVFTILKGESFIRKTYKGNLMVV